MVRSSILTATLALLALAAPAGAALRDADPSPSTPPPLAAKLTSCDVGATSAERSVGFEGSMPTVSGADTLAMRFDLQVRHASTARWKAQAAASFGRYVTSDAGAAGLVYDKSVDALQAGSQYRALVRFRWKDADGKVIRTAAKLSPSCRQPDLRPDLRVAGISVAPDATAGQSVFSVTIRNVGKGAAGVPFGLTLAIGGAAPLSQSVPSLAAETATTVDFTAPACTRGSELVATVDPEDAIDEVDDTDNARTITCPAAR